MIKGLPVLITSPVLVECFVGQIWADVLKWFADDGLCVFCVSAQLPEALVEEHYPDITVNQVDRVVERVYSRPVELFASTRFRLMASGLDSPQDAVVKAIVMGYADFLGEVIVGPGPECFGGQHFAALAGEKDQRGVVLPLAKLGQKLQAVHPGHLEVAEDAIEFLLCQ